MSCDIVCENLSLFLDGEADRDMEESIKEHLASCPQCQQELEAYKTIHGLLGTLEPLDPPDTLKKTIMKTLSNEKPVSFRQRLFSNRLITWGATAAVLFIIVGSVGMSAILERSKTTDTANTEGGAGIMLVEEADSKQTELADVAETPNDQGISAMVAPEPEPESSDAEVEINGLEEPRMYVANGSRGMAEAAGVCSIELETGQEMKLHKEILALRVENLPETLKQLSASKEGISIIHQDNDEIRLLILSKNEEVESIERIKALGVLESESQYEISCLQEYERLITEQEQLTTDEEKQTLQAQIDLMKQFDSSEAVLYDITILEGK